MKNKALIDNNGIVINTAVFDDNCPEQENWIEFTDNNCAEVGGSYIDGYFYGVQPFPSWLRDGNGNWVPPVPRPQTHARWIWNENKQKWDENQPQELWTN